MLFCGPLVVVGSGQRRYSELLEEGQPREPNPVACRS